MTPQELMEAAQNRKAIVGFFPYNRNAKAPAAFVIGMPFQYVMFRIGAASVYRKDKHAKVDKGRI